MTASLILWVFTFRGCRRLLKCPTLQCLPIMNRFHFSICSFLLCLTVEPKNYRNEASICPPKSYTPTDAWSKLQSPETQDWQVSGKDVYSFNLKMNFWQLKGTWISWVAFSWFPTTTTTIPGKNTLKFKHMVLNTSTQSPFSFWKLNH